MTLWKRDAVTSSRNSSDQNQTSGSCPELQLSVSLTFVLLYSLLFVVGSCLNVFSIRMHFCSPSRSRSSVSVYLKNLAAADLLVSFSLPIRIAHYASGSALPLHWFYCSVGATVFYLNMYASILFMGYIAANRYLKILRPLTPHFLQTVQGSRRVSALTWIVLWAGAGAYTVLSIRRSHHNTPFRSLNCDTSHGKKMAPVYLMVHCCLTALFFCVLLALFFFYSSISRRLSAARVRQPQSSTSRKLQRSQRNMLLLWMVFSVCFIPYHLVRLPFAVLGERCSQLLYLLKEMTVLLSALNVCLDPLIYLLFSEAFREELGLGRQFEPASISANTPASGNIPTSGNITANTNIEANVTTTANANTAASVITMANVNTMANDNNTANDNTAATANITATANTTANTITTANANTTAANANI